MSPGQLQETFQSWFNQFLHVIELLYLFFEIHLPKIVLIVAMLLCIFDKCAIYIVLAVLIVLSCLMGRPIYIFAIYSSSVLISLMLLARMIYQINYIQHDIWNVQCEVSNVY